MPENEIKKAPVEQLQMNAVSAPEPPAVIPAATPAQRPQSYAEKVQGLTADERIWQLAKSKAVAMANLPAIACDMAQRMGVSYLFVMQRNRSSFQPT